MYSVNSIDAVPMALHTEIGFVIPSPVECRRTHEACKKAFGEMVKVDGIEYVIRGFGYHVPASPISVGENILVIVKGSIDDL